jgi:hypothetical protein
MTGNFNQVVNAIVRSLPPDILQLLLFSLSGGYDKFTYSIMANASGRAILIEQRLTTDTELSFQRACRVINACVYDFAIPAANAFAETRPLLQHQNIFSGNRQLPGNRQANDARPHYADVYHL